ncbi:MAG TPA: bifunctional UDP-3-O-[3-hydroxymyristoyl] N-acetylglucosamine deacetylase/3-hydroxyacyl-ACP dehydratase [Longimicrobiales bacterium]|nr:bifunctional UDP-3-O-[3-hydroxymyristoyl] N-acetylglucosamine deacetylase/3-hydroxyacyl-ACP dehydratase [Longimicrobiales bacterium]
MSQKQQTIAEQAKLEGVGLHTGATAHLRFLPAEENTGIRFRRTDLRDAADIPAHIDYVVSTDRGTALAMGEARMHTVEHLLAAVVARQIDNLIIEVDAPEIPILDGSFKPFFDALDQVELREQSEPAKYVELSGPVSAKGPAGASYVAVPDENFRVSATIQFDHPLIQRQFASFEVNHAGFGADVAPARTFGFMREAEELYKRGLVKGVTLSNAIVLNETGLEHGELRFADEFVRHKIGDVIGDFALIGRRVKAHVIAERPSHAGNLEIARAIVQAAKNGSNKPIVDITRIMQHLPHRYPMLLVDRIVEYEAGKRIVGIKNVTINEPFFQGHYPGHPVMPGVLIVEAMAQVGGLLMMDTVENIHEKVVYFMSLDNVKWRRPVTPGDQLRFELEILQLRKHVCRMKGEGYVDGQLVAEAEMMARIVDR